MALTLTFRGGPSAPIDVRGLVPSAVGDKSLAEIERFSIHHGNRVVPLAELFRVAGDASDRRMIFAGDLSGVHRIGAKLDGGAIRVEGSAGRHVGAEMRDGELHVAGDAGDWLGAEMHGGLIHVRGRAGESVGAAYSASPRGMTGGVLLVGGDVGRFAGHSMRRGLIAVGGNAGDFAAADMIAGTVLVLGTTGGRPGAGMRRGTLAVFGEPPKLLSTFRSAGRTRPLFLRLYFAAVRRRGLAIPADLDDAPVRLFAGDQVAVGNGEILTRAE